MAKTMTFLLVAAVVIGLVGFTPLVGAGMPTAKALYYLLLAAGAGLIVSGSIVQRGRRL